MPSGCTRQVAHLCCSPSGKTLAVAARPTPALEKKSTTWIGLYTVTTAPLTAGGLRAFECSAARAPRAGGCTIHTSIVSGMAADHGWKVDALPPACGKQTRRSWAEASRSSAQRRSGDIFED